MPYPAHNISPLLVAVVWNDTQLVNELISRKVDINANDEKGLTPSHWAVLRNDIDVVKLLLKENPIIQKDSYGFTPLDYAENNYLTEIVELLKGIESRSTLLEPSTQAAENDKQTGAYNTPEQSRIPNLTASICYQPKLTVKDWPGVDLFNMINNYKKHGSVN